MKIFVPLALSLALFAAPAAAQEYPLSNSTIQNGAADILTDPVQQEKMAASLAMMVDALLRVNIGPLADVMAKVDPETKARDLPSNATLGHILGRDSEDAAAMGDQVRAGAQMAGAAASVLGAYMPVLTEMARDMASQVELNLRSDPK